MNTFLELVNITIWPMTVIILSLIFRADLHSTIKRLTQLKYKDIEAFFDKELNDIEDKANKIIKENNESILIELPDEYERIYRLIDISPIAAITEAWREIEIATALACKAVGIEIEGKIAGTRHINQLLQMKKIKSDLVTIYSQLRLLRNKAAHSIEFQIQSDEAERYVRLAIGISKVLRDVGN